MKPEIKKTSFKLLLERLHLNQDNSFSLKLLGNHCCWSEIINLNGPIYSQSFQDDQDLWLNSDADTLIVFGNINPLTLQQIKSEYETLLPPKRIIAFGQCAINGGPFQNYSHINLNDHFEVSMIIPGCPPTPEQLIQSLKSYGEE
jgi:NADH:ubiquinone oxidoreductase subunit B-like Fe-S oxidoreductase